MKKEWGRWGQICTEIGADRGRYPARSGQIGEISLGSGHLDWAMKFLLIEACLKHGCSKSWLSKRSGRLSFDHQSTLVEGEQDESTYN